MITQNIKKIFVIFLIGIFLSQGTANAITQEELADHPFLIESSALRAQLPTPMYLDPLDYVQSQFDAPNPSQFQAGTAYNGGQEAISSQTSYVQTTSVLIDSENNKYSSTIICEGYEDELCADKTKEAHVVLPVCSANIVGACIESFSLSNNLQEENGIFQEYVDNTVSTELKGLIRENWLTDSQSIDEDGFQDILTWDGIPSRNLPYASTPSKWTVANFDHVAEDNSYLVTAKISLSFEDTGLARPTGFYASIVPFKEITLTPLPGQLQVDSFRPPVWYTRNDTDPNGLTTEAFPTSASHPLASFDNPSALDPVTCAFEEMGVCGVAVKFSDGVTASLKVRIPKSLGGWFHGRMSDTNISLAEFDTTLNTLSIAAKPVKVAITSSQWEPCNPDNNALALKLYPEDYLQDSFCNRLNLWARDPDLPQSASDPESEDYNPRYFSNLLGEWGQWQPTDVNSVNTFVDLSANGHISELAKGEVQMWSIGSLPFSEKASSCLSDKSTIQGVISTNAMVYQADIPKFIDGKFVYQIASTHKDYLGSVINGDYTLAVRTSVARCLWGFGNGEITGNVQVTGATNEEKSSTTTFSISPDWIRITAIGFTFSESNVALSLSEKKNVAGSVKSTLTPTVGSKSRTTIANVAKLIGVEAPAKSRYFISISKESRKFCRFDNGRLLAVKAGNCTVTVTALAPKPKPIRLSGAIQNVESTTLTKQQLVEKLGRTWVPKSAVTISVSKSSRQACYVKAGKLFVKPNSNCEYRLVLSEPRPKPVKVTGTIQVN